MGLFKKVFGKKENNVKTPEEKLEKALEDAVLYCANPQCDSKVISGAGLAYSPEHRELYHDGECALLANSHKAVFNEGGIVLTSVDYRGL